MPIISLTTDFGTQDSFVGTMKGVILRICPDAQIVDISHQVPPQNISSAAFMLLGSTKYFSPGTVHVIVIDPGVGTARRAIAARLGEHIYVAPDNGVLTLLFEQAEQGGEPIEIVDLDKPEYYLDEISTTFHGRDIFSPCGAHLATGVPLNEIGTPIRDALRIDIPQAAWEGNVLNGEVIRIDHFGNIGSNIRSEHLGELNNKKDKIIVEINEMKIEGMVSTFGERSPGEFVALISSEGYLEISIVNGDAARALNGKLGDVIRVISKFN